MANNYNRIGKSTSPAKLRTLSQYKDMTVEEFNLAMSKKELSIESSKVLESRIEDKLEQFSEDYDLTDLKINDREVLRGMIQSIISLEDYEQYLFKLRAEGISPENILVIDKIQRVMSDLSKRISEAQNDLNITRKVRKSDKETSVIAHIDWLKEKARTFYASRMSYVFCPKCHTLLCTIWTLYPKQERNKIALVCERELDDGKVCGEKVLISTKELLDNRGTNDIQVMPESML